MSQLWHAWALATGLPQIRKGVGKRPSRPEGAGSAESASISLLQIPTLAKGCAGATALVQVSRVGELTALVDSGAVTSAIRYDLVRDSGLAIRPTSKRWVCADGAAGGVVGTIGLTVQYEERLVRLPEAVVFRDMQLDFLLGMEWIDAANVAVMTGSGR